MELAIVDLDGVIANSDARFAQATANGKIDWRIALNGEHVHLDTLIEGSIQALIALEKRYTVVFLTSRPDSMRAATLEWFRVHNVALRRLEMKPSSAQYTKTKAWKAERVGKLAREYNASHIVLVEDEQANIDEILAHNSALSIDAYTSLNGAVTANLQ